MLLKSREAFRLFNRDPVVIKTAGDTITSTGSGIACLTMRIVNWVDVDVKVQALYCPNIATELLSICSLTDIGWTFKVQNRTATLVSPDGKSTVKLKRHCSMYTVDAQPWIRVECLALSALLMATPHN